MASSSATGSPGRVRRKLYTQADDLAHLYPADWPVTPKLRASE